ncbi:MAG TPA: MraY family glycosyltransferase [Solirubrobacteraceae bacterium]
MTERDAILGFIVAFAVAALLTPLTSRLARAVGAVDQPKERGLAEGGTPLLGGFAMLAAVLAGALLFLEFTTRTEDRLTGILVGACVIAVIGAFDDKYDLHPAIKLAGQIVAATIPVQAGVEVTNITLPEPIGPQDLGDLGPPLTVLGLVAIMNVVNFSDGVDGLAAGICAICAATFAVIAFDLDRNYAAILAAVTAGAALGFLVHNFPPASAFMGDCGANLLGLLLGCIAVEGAVKTQAVLALIFPLVVLAVPFVDTTFVVLKRLKYRRAPWQADANHFHHRFSRIGFSTRKTILYLYAWALMLAGFALALRFVPYSDNHGNLEAGWSALMGALGLVVLAASVYLVYVLEILKFNFRARRLTREQAQQAWETGEFPAISEEDAQTSTRP